MDGYGNLFKQKRYVKTCKRINDMILNELPQGKKAARTRRFNEIVNSLNSIPGEIITARSRSELTRRITDCIVKLGQQRGYEVFAKGSSTTNREWLYDVTWKENDRYEAMQSVSLAVEVELEKDIGEIILDFEKILQSGAELAILIYDISADNGREDVLTKIFEAIPIFRGTKPDVLNVIHINRKAGYFIGNQLI